MLRTGSHRKAPLQMIVFGLLLIGAQAYMEAGEDAAKYAVRGSLQKLLIQVPAGIVAVFVASRLIDLDFGTLGVVALKLAGIMVLAEGVSCWIPIPFFSMMAEVAVMLVGFFWMFEAGKWGTYLLVFLNIAALFGARYLVDNYADSAHRYWNASVRSTERRPARVIRQP